MSKHTKEPWLVWDTGNGLGIAPTACKDDLVPNVSAFAFEVARIRAPEPWCDNAWAQAKANGVRIVECVNALAELENPSAIGEVLTTAIKLINESSESKAGNSTVSTADLVSLRDALAKLAMSA